MTTITPRLVVPDPDLAARFYEDVLGATRTFSAEDDGALVAVGLTVGGSPLVVSPTVEDWGWLDPHGLGGSPVLLQVDTPTPDDLAQRAVDRGGQLLIPVADRSWGRREGRVRDPFGHLWILSGPVG